MRPSDMKVTCCGKRQAEPNHPGRKLKWLGAEQRLDGDGPDEATFTQDNEDAPFLGDGMSSQGRQLKWLFRHGLPASTWPEWIARLRENYRRTLTTNIVAFISLDLRRHKSTFMESRRPNLQKQFSRRISAEKENPKT